MKSGSPAFGTPEYVKAAFGAGQLARFLGLPWRSSNATASNTPDAQSVYESQMSLWGALFGGCNFVLHAAGWLESGLTTSYEKFILDIEMLQMFAEVFQPVGATPRISRSRPSPRWAPGGHFFGCAHTMERYRSAFYAPLVSDWRNYGSWAEDGGKTATERASGIWQSTLQRYVAPGARSGGGGGARCLRRAAHGGGRCAARHLMPASGAQRVDHVACGYAAVAISQVRGAPATYHGVLRGRAPRS